MPWAAWRQILKRAWTLSGIHGLSLLSAGLAFFFFLSLTPLLTATVIVYGLTGSVQMVETQMRSVEPILPADVSSILDGQLTAAVTTNSGTAGLALAVALGFALYGSSYATGGMIGALNRINGEQETRGFFRLLVLSVGFTVLAILVGLTGILASGILTWLGETPEDVLGTIGAWAVSAFFVPLMFAAGSMCFALMMRIGPCRRPAKWRWLAPGALLSLVLWVGISLGFSAYVAHISDYNATYASLSAVVVFLMWVYLSSYVLLLGALLNVEIERQTLVDTTIGPDKPIGQRGAVVADSHISFELTRWREKRDRRRAAVPIK
jgi:membrane protein